MGKTRTDRERYGQGRRKLAPYRRRRSKRARWIWEVFSLSEPRTLKGEAIAFGELLWQALCCFANEFGKALLEVVGL